MQQCTIYANEEEEQVTNHDDEGNPTESTIWKYDYTEFIFTPGKLLTEEVIKENPELFLALEGNVDTLVANITQNVQDYIDSWAQERGYDNIHTAAGYKESTVMRFQVEGTILAKLRDDCWLLVHQLENRAMNGDRTALSDLLYLPAGLPEPDFSSVPEITE